VVFGDEDWLAEEKTKRDILFLDVADGFSEK
jgi:hypothetical protein